MNQQRETRRERGHLARELALTLTCAAVTALVAVVGLAMNREAPAAGAGMDRVQPLMMLSPAPAPSAAVPAARMDVPEFPPATEPVQDQVAPSISVEEVIESPITGEQASQFMPTFDGRRIRPVKTLRMLVTAYSPDWRSCGDSADGITASGYTVNTNASNLVAADTSILPFGTILTIPGYNNGWPVPVLDRGGAIKGNRLDVLYPTHEQAIIWGKQWIEVTVWEYAD